MCSFRRLCGETGVTPASLISRSKDRLTFRAPPHFLDPVQSAWRISRYTEQQPARH